jgi:hypothetical protein
LFYDLGEETGPALGFVDPVLEKAGGGNVAVPVTNLVRGTLILSELLIIQEELSEHRFGREIGPAVVLKALVARDIPDRMKRRESCRKQQCLLGVLSFSFDE